MKVTYNWLKDFVEIGLFPQALADKLTMAGIEVTSLEEKEGDFVFEIEITSNRPDWLSVVGIAREVAAITGKKLRLFKESALRKTLSSKENLDIEIEDKKDCLLYSARIMRDVKITNSPDWLRKRLELVGCRSINSVVDITNYVLFESGQPLHAFDLDKLSPGSIVVRRAKKGEKITAIDMGVKTLDEGILIIADKEKPVAIAGVMGGKDTEVSLGTKNILLEAAVFSPALVRSGRQKLGLQSESSYRFERGVNPRSTFCASARAAGMIQEIASGKLVLAKSSSTPKVKIKRVNLQVSSANKILGANLSRDKMKKILLSLGFSVKTGAQDNFSVGVPSHRPDVNLGADLIEEIARVFGYEKIACTAPKIAPRLIPCAKGFLVSLAKTALSGLGLREVITHSLIDKETLRQFETDRSLAPVEISNPLSNEQAVLRPTLIPSLAFRVAYNLNQKQDYVNIFEIANVFSEEGPLEELFLSLCLCGTKSLLLEEGLVKEEAGFLHIKGVLERLFARLGIENYGFEAEGRVSCFAVYVNGVKIGLIVELQKKSLDMLGIKNKRVFAAEISLDRLFSFAQLKKKFIPAPRFPGIARDISFILKEDVPVKKALQAMLEKGKPLLRQATITDYYKGKQIPAGYRGLTVSCLYLSDERTLTEAEISPLHASLCGILTEAFAARIR